MNRRDPFLEKMIDREFKILPMREQYDMGEEPFLDEYLQELAIEANGAYDTFPELYERARYVSVTNTLQYIRRNWKKMTFPAYRRSVLKMTNCLDRLLKEDERRKEADDELA